MKILIVGRCVTPLPPRNGGGAEWHGYHLAMALHKLGHDVHYVTNYSEPINFNGVVTYNTYTKIVHNEISRFPFMSFNKWLTKHFKENILAANKARSVLLREEDFDIIHCHGNLATVILSKYKKNVPIVYTEHDASPWICTYRSSYERLVRKSFYYILNKKAIDRASHIITISDAQKKFFVENWNIAQEKITVIHNGVDTLSFRPQNNNLDGKLIKKYSLPKDYGIFVGRLEPRKCIDHLIQSLQKTDISVVIVGEGPDKEKLDKLRYEIGIAGKVILTGSVSDDDLKGLYSGAKYFVIPSISEVGPTLSILEAMSSGIPVVASRIPGVSEILKDKYNGLLFDPNNINSLRNAQQSLMEDSILREIMGRRARQTVEKKYNWNTVAEKVIDVYNTIKENNR